jgi:hypothetical protein
MEPPRKNTRLRIVDGEEQQPQRKPKRKDPNGPWSLRGVSVETRALVTRAAERERRPLGQWADFHLRIAANKVLGSGGESSETPVTPNLPTQVMQEQIFSALLQKVTELADGQARLQEQVGQLSAKEKAPSLLGRIFRR